MSNQLLNSKYAKNWNKFLNEQAVPMGNSMGAGNVEGYPGRKLEEEFGDDERLPHEKEEDEYNANGWTGGLGLGEIDPDSIHSSEEDQYDTDDDFDDFSDLNDDFADDMEDDLNFDDEDEGTHDFGWSDEDEDGEDWDSEEDEEDTW